MLRADNRVSCCIGSIRFRNNRHASNTTFSLDSMIQPDPKPKTAVCDSRLPRSVVCKVLLDAEHVHYAGDMRVSSGC